MAASQPDIPPPLQDIPNAKQKRYDRQLRLWGEGGQIALEDSHILLINNGPGVTGVETLKNVVLPGVGQFSILDSSIVSEADLGVNFFLEDESLGKFRADETVKFLLELNPGVRGYALREVRKIAHSLARRPLTCLQPLESFIARSDAFASYSLILVTAPVDPAILASIQQATEALQIPLFYIHSVGYYSHFSISLPSAFPIVETHPDPITTSDLRLLNPWPELQDFAKAKTAGLAEMSAHEKGHIPYVCLLLYYLDEWRRAHEGGVPKNYKEKQEFRDQYVRKGSADEENFDEACAAVLKALNPATASSTVSSILTAGEAKDLDANSSPFWIVANAIQQFYTKHGELPLPGAVPDMKAQSSDYIQLQNIYKAKARKDFAEVLATVRSIEKTTGRSQKLAVDEKEVENFCKGAAHVHLVRGRPLQIVDPGKPVTFRDRATSLFYDLINPESLIGIYIAFLAWDEFVATHSTDSMQSAGNNLRVPGSNDAELEIDQARMIGIAHKIVDLLINEADSRLEDPEYSDIKAKIERICVEMVRAGGGELHNIASLSGGMIAQEVIKVITKQYIPVDNTCLFDGIGSRCYVMRV